METLVLVIVKFHTICSKLSYSSSKVQYFAAKNSYYHTFFLKLKRSLAKIVNLGFSVYDRFINKIIILIKFSREDSNAEICNALLSSPENLFEIIILIIKRSYIIDDVRVYHTALIKIDMKITSGTVVSYGVFTNWGALSLTSERRTITGIVLFLFVDFTVQVSCK